MFVSLFRTTLIVYSFLIFKLMYQNYFCKYFLAGIFAWNLKSNNPRFESVNLSSLLHSGLPVLRWATIWDGTTMLAFLSDAAEETNTKRLLVHQKQLRKISLQCLIRVLFDQLQGTFDFMVSSLIGPKCIAKNRSWLYSSSPVRKIILYSYWMYCWRVKKFEITRSAPCLHVMTLRKCSVDCPFSSHVTRCWMRTPPLQYGHRPPI